MIPNYYANLNYNIKNEVVDIAKKIDEEKQNVQPDEKKIATLMYQQLIKGMYLNTGNIRNYNPY